LKVIFNYQWWLRRCRLRSGRYSSRGRYCELRL